MKRFLQKIVTYAIVFIILFVLVYAIFNFAGYGQINFYSFVFSKNVEGVVENVEKVSPGMSIVGGTQTSSRDLFSFAVGIKAKDGEIITGTSEDRQWAIVKVGQCARAKFYPYPPWELDKSGTYYNVRLLKLFECNSGAVTLTVPPETPPAAAPTVQAVSTAPAAAAPPPVTAPKAEKPAKK